MTLVALIDGPLAPGHPALARQEVFRAGPDGPVSAHAAALADAVLAGHPGAGIENLVVFAGCLATDADSVARAIAAATAPVILCAFGMARPDDALAGAVRAQLARGASVIAAAPARGAEVYPAGFAGVLSVQGDARCGPGLWSHLGLPHAAYGAAPAVPGHPGVAGASAAAGHLAGIVARLRAGGLEGGALGRALAEGAAWTGRERRGAAV